MSRLLAAYPTGPVYVIVDNASIHTSHAVRAWLAMNIRLQLAYLPACAGYKLNPVEKVWWSLEDDLSANYSFKKLAGLDDAIRRYSLSFTRYRPPPSQQRNGLYRRSGGSLNVKRTFCQLLRTRAVCNLAASRYNRRRSVSAFGSTGRSHSGNAPH